MSAATAAAPSRESAIARAVAMRPTALALRPGAAELSVADWLGAARPLGSSVTGTKMAAGLVAVCGLLAVLAAGAEGGPRTLVLLENGNLRDTHSMFFRSLAGTERAAAGSREGLDGAGEVGLATEGQDGGGWDYLREKGMLGVFGSGRGSRLQFPWLG